MPLRLVAIGTTAASELATIRPQVTAVVTAVRFTEGSVVKAGAPLFQLDDRAFAAAVAQAEADLARARAAERQARAGLERDRAQLVLATAGSERTASLAKQELASTHDQEQAQATLDQARATITAAEAAVDTAKAGVTAAEANLARARLELSWCTVTAPIGGRTGTAGLTAGSLATSGQTVLATIARMQPMFVGLSVPASALPAVRAAQAKGQLAVSVVPEGDGPPEPGVLDFIDNQIDPATATVRLRASCPNAAERLWPNQQCRVVLELGVDAAVVTVPERAVQTGQRGTLVWVVAADRTASPKKVETGRTVDGQVIITKGLDGGESVVVDGQLRLTKGATVALPEERKAKDGAQAEKKAKDGAAEAKPEAMGGGAGRP
jgi:multidrug efflux system membrane fusion protein